MIIDKSQHRIPLPGGRTEHRDRRSLLFQLTAVISGTIFATLVLGGPMWAKHWLVNDRTALFSLFADNLFSLNAFGEPAWWHPGVQLGFPQYYLSILGWTALEPIYVLLGAVVWLAGRLGIVWHSYLPLYFAYCFFLVPLNLMLSLWVLTRTLFKDQRVIYFVIVLSMFCPGILFGYTDSGVEITPYGFYFLAALIRFVRFPERRVFLLMIGFLLLTVVCLNHLFLYWELVFLGIVALVVSLQTLRRPARTFSIVRRVPWPYWAAAIGALIVCALPSLVTFSHGAEVLRGTTGTRIYEFGRLRAGNPLEMLAQSTPGVGFAWTQDLDPAASFEMQLMNRQGRYISFGYAGMLLLPLVWLGAVMGRRRWRGNLQAVLIFGMGIIVLSSYSPFLAPILAIPSPLRAVNHYSDTSLRLGFFAFFLLGGAMGLESALRFRVVRRKLLPACFAVGVLFSLALLLRLGREAATSSHVFGFFFALVFLYSIALLQLARARGRAALGQAYGLILFLSLLDTATVANQHLRLVLAPHADVVNEPGTASDFLSGEFAGAHAKTLLYLSGLDSTAIDRVQQQWPRLALLSAVGDKPQAPANGTIAITDSTFNRLRLQIETPAAARLLLRDANFAFWRAYVDGQRIAIEEDIPHLKTVVVPGGTSKVEFRFLPGILFLSILLAYSVIVFWFVTFMLTPPGALAQTTPSAASRARSSSESPSSA